MNEAQFAAWLDAYGRAWQTGDAKRAMTLFAPAATYYETPFDPPLVGLDAIHDYWRAGAGTAQRNEAFTYEVLAVAGDLGIAHWAATFARLPSGAAVRLDGALAARFDTAGACVEFREWWHRFEAPGAGQG